MGLSAMAKELQNDPNYGENQALRQMRQFTAKHNHHEINRRWAAFHTLQETLGETMTLEEKYRLEKMAIEISHDSSLGKLYTATLNAASARERTAEGGGAAYYRANKDRILAVEKKIFEEKKAWESIQVSLEDLKK